jgi:Protein of unknown function (DUF3307)
MIQVSLSQVLILLILLQVKHFIADGPLQTAKMVTDKGHYGRQLGLAHAGIHGLATLIMLTIFQLPTTVVAGLGLLDAVVHYHVDFTKETVVRRMGWTTRDGPFWWALSADQALHQLTYLALAWLAFTAA